MRFVIAGVALFASCGAFAQEQVIIRGRPAEPGELPHTVFFYTGASACTGTIVGPRVLLTAGHCVRQGGRIRFFLNDVWVQGTATVAPLYRRGTDHDLALVALDAEVFPDRYASVALGQVTAPPNNVALSGYGCNSFRTRNSGTLYIGQAPLVRATGYDWETGSLGSSQLCFGDSGGPVWLIRDNVRYDWVVAVNSKTNPRGFQSYVTRLDTKASNDFVRGFARRSGLAVCGVTHTCE